MRTQSYAILCNKYTNMRPDFDLPYLCNKASFPLAWFACCLLALFFMVQSCSRSPSGMPSPSPDFSAIPYDKLSQYGLFHGALSKLQPAEGVLPYAPRTPLFSDYAHKARFVWMPAGAQAVVDSSGCIQFPEHTILVKHFYYLSDEGNPASSRRHMETRLLIRRNHAWEAYTYEWNDKGTEAWLMQVGNIKPVSWKAMDGTSMTIDYVIPNKNQCKSCHNIHNTLQPIGTKVRNLNFEFTYPDGTMANQLLRWSQTGYLAAAKEVIAKYPAIPQWDAPQTGSEAERAAAYLDANCGHCHRPEGPANTTGTYLHWEEASLHRRGMFKSPVAAGKGSGGRSYGIVPGQPEASILVYRMESDDPGIMMPELGRTVPHKEGIALIKTWIAGLPKDSH